MSSDPPVAPSLEEWPALPSPRPLLDPVDSPDDLLVRPPLPAASATSSAFGSPYVDLQQTPGLSPGSDELPSPPPPPPTPSEVEPLHVATTAPPRPPTPSHPSPAAHANGVTNGDVDIDTDDTDHEPAAPMTNGVILPNPDNQNNQTTPEQTDMLLLDLSRLDGIPAEEDEWTACLVTPEDVLAGTSAWSELYNHPAFYVIGKTNTGWIMVAVASPAVPVLHDLGIRCIVASVYDSGYSNGGAVWQPSELEERRYGHAEARLRAMDRFEQRAVRGIDHRRGRGLARLLRLIAPAGEVGLSVEWAVLRQGIRIASGEVLRNIIDLCTLVGLVYSLKKACTTCAHAVLTRSTYEWTALFAHVGRQAAVEDDARDRQALALMRHVVRIAGGPHDPDQELDRIDVVLSAADNLRLLGRLLCLVRSHPPATTRSWHRLGFREPWTLRTIDRAVEAALLRTDLLLFVPVRFPSRVYGHLPRDLIDHLPCCVPLASLDILAALAPGGGRLFTAEHALAFILATSARMRLYGNTAVKEWVVSAAGQAARLGLAVLAAGTSLAIEEDMLRVALAYADVVERS